MCEATIRKRQDELLAGATVSIDLQGGGYDGRVIVNIAPNNPVTFNTDWENADPTRFPARIKAAATALLNVGCKGKFEISHSSGSLTIRTLQAGALTREQKA